MVWIRWQTLAVQVFPANRKGVGSLVSRPYLTRSIFTDQGDQQAFVKKGYFTKTVMTRDEAASALEDFVKMAPATGFVSNPALGDQIKYHVTDLDNDLKYKKSVTDYTVKYFSSVVDKILVDHRILTATLFVKPAHSKAIELHNDWTLQEDNSEPTIYVWIPLVDVTPENGPVSILEGSHGVLDFLHGARTRAACVDTNGQFDDEVVSVPVKAGEALVFDAAALRGSSENTTDQPRIALRLACIPNDRKGALHKQSAENPDMIETYSMERDEFADHSGLELVQGQLKTAMQGKSIDPKLTLSGNEIRMLIREGDRIRAGETTMMTELEKYQVTNAEVTQSVAHAGPQADKAPEPAMTPYRRVRRLGGKGLRFAKRVVKRAVNAVRPGTFPVYQARPTLPTKPTLPTLPTVPTKEVSTAADYHAEKKTTATPSELPYEGKDFTAYPQETPPWTPFGDAWLDGDLAKDGYTTTRFLTAAEVDELAEALLDAETALDSSDVHIDTQFQLSAFNNDAGYKERVYDAVWGTLREKIEALLPDYEPLVINVFDKPVSEHYDAVPIHQNPSFVEEPDHRSVSLWIPFADVDRDNGAIGVLPGSHGRFNTMRSGNMEHEEVFADVQATLENEALVPVNMKKGELLALDDSIVHWSYPNVSDRPRKAVQLIMVPRGVPHIYYFYDDANPAEPMMDLYEVDHRFFYGFNCKARPETLKHIDRRPYAYRKILADELFKQVEQA